MKYLVLLILIILVSCSARKPINPLPAPAPPEASTVGVDSVASDIKLGMDMETSVGSSIEIANAESVYLLKKYPKLKIVNVKSPITKTTTNKGHVAYHIPTIMNVRDTYQVSLRISKTTVNIYEELEGVVKTTIIPITETMEVKLIDPSPIDDKTFSIIPDNNAEQLIEDGDEVTKWTWNVMPLKTGNANLKIVVSIIKNGHKKETVYQDNIRIRTNPVKTIPLFFSKYWQWMLSTLIIPFGVWLYNSKKK
jgi:hypothetical protein